MNTIISVVTRLKANVLIYAVDIPCMPALPQSLSQTDGGRMHGCTVLLRFKGFPRAYDVFLSPETHHIVQKAFWTTPHLLRASLWWGWGMPSHHPSLHWRWKWDSEEWNHLPEQSWCETRSTLDLLVLACSALAAWVPILVLCGCSCLWCLLNQITGSLKSRTISPLG